MPVPILSPCTSSTLQRGLRSGPSHRPAARLAQHLLSNKERNGQGYFLLQNGRLQRRTRRENGVSGDTPDPGRGLPPSALPLCFREGNSPGKSAAKKIGMDNNSKCGFVAYLADFLR